VTKNINQPVQHGNSIKQVSCLNEQCHDKNLYRRKGRFQSHDQHDLENHRSTTATVYKEADRYHIFSYYPKNQDRNFEMYQIEMDEGCIHESIGHSSNSSEYVMVLEGHMILDVNGTEYRLAADDALFFDASYPHIYKNMSEKRVKAVLIIYYV
jgi:quercetin dioxygenase-like cupin family protein